MPTESLLHQGLPAVRCHLPSGDEVIATLHGGQVVSWCPAQGGERLFLSDKAVFGQDAALRGGVPVCFPQFNERGPLIKHGFARRLDWRVAEQADDGFTLQLAHSPATQVWWPEHFELRLQVQLWPQVLRLALEVYNPGPRAWSFTAALHSYWRVREVTQVRLQGLAGTRCWDARADRRFVEAGDVLDFGELAPPGFDRVYTMSADGHEPPPLTLHPAQGTPRLVLRQSASFSEAVVWNPGEAEAARLADMPAQGWRQMLCVEAARIDEPVTLAPGARWVGWQQAEFLA